MPPPVAVTSENPGAAVSALVHLFGGQTDYEVQEARQDAAEQRAFAVMRTYDSSTEANTTSLASFSAPPQVVVDAPSAAPGTASRGVAHEPVTITWGSPAGGLSSNTGRNSTRADGGTRPGGVSRGTGGGPRASSRRERDEAEPVDRSVTEDLGQAGAFFDEQPTLSRPVIGGEPN
jgi:hypothetical protein